MALEIKQQLRLTQQLVMTPQLQQAIKLLQLSRQELADTVVRELQENPILEEVSENEEELPRHLQADVESATPSGEGDAALPENREASDAEKIADIDWQSYAEAYPHTGFQGAAGGDEDRRSVESVLVRRETLADHLLWQLQLSDMGEVERAAAQWIIGNLDEVGYLRVDLEEVAGRAGCCLESAEVALHKVQQFDPLGVGARDLRECLLLQIEAQPERDELVHTLVADHLMALQRRDFRGLGRLLDVEPGDVQQAARRIGRLEPRPGRPFGGEDPVYIIPDITVLKIGEEYHTVLNEDGMPRLRINQLYRDVLSGGRGTVGRDARDYVQERLRSALWLIKSIHQRQRTIYKVMHSIIGFQREFFDRGIQYLRPLNLRDVALDIDMHESTVSRVTTNKYANTPQGIFELKFFFTSSVNRVEGEAIASESVKARIRRIIAAEDPHRPHSDQGIADLLRNANVDIARRTVTKYREAMNILSSTKRREVR